VSHPGAVVDHAPRPQRTASHGTPAPRRSHPSGRGGERVWGRRVDRVESHGYVARTAISPRVALSDRMIIAALDGTGQQRRLQA